LRRKGFYMTLIHTLLAWDAAFFHFINNSLANPVFDVLLPWCREKWIWAPLYLFIAAFSWLRFGNRGWLVLLGLVAVVAIADGTSSQLIKKNVRRLRPCNDPALTDRVRLRVASCGSGYSFTSSHAANHFGIALFMIGLFGRSRRWLPPVALLWASLIALSQVYVGVHYPGDVICGALVGASIGWGVAWVLRRWVVDNSAKSNK